MKIKDILNWYRSKRWFERLFLILLLLRPIVEPYFFLKNTSPLLSPLYWIAILTFFICLFGIFSSKKYPSKLDRSYAWWVILVVINTICFAFSSEFITFIIFALKLLYPVLIYYFLRTFIHNKKDLQGILIIILISCFFASIWFLKDIATHGLNLRDQSSFADIVNYGFYINFALVIMMYFVLNGKTILFAGKNNNLYFLLSILLFSGATHWGIKHMSSIAVMAVIILLFSIFLIRKNVVYASVFITLIIGSFLYFGKTFYKEVINDRLEKEIEVVEGERRQGQGLHGRISRWIWLEKEYSAADPYAQFFGYPTMLKYSGHMVGITPHNDFLRILFFTGILGIFFFLRFIALAMSRIRHLARNERFLSIGIFLIFMLYSLSTVPSFYPGFNNLIFTLFAFLALPIRKLHETNS